MNFEELEKKVIKWGEDRGIYDPFNGSCPTAQYEKLMEEVEELKNAIDGVKLPELVDAIGDIMVVLTHIAKLVGTDLFTCYSAAYLEIKERKGKMVNGIFVKER
jgi:NTP pyrophosphatase (non-canonical NTP hydrolase)